MTSEMLGAPIAPARPSVPDKRPPRRRPSGAPPPLPHHLRSTGRGWLIAVIVIVITTVVVFHNGLRGVAVPITVFDDTIVRWVSGVDAPGLHKSARIVAGLSSWWVIQSLSWALPLALLVLRRWRHLLVTMIVIQLAQVLAQII